MGRMLIRRALVLLLLTAALAPVLETFDRWDSTPGLASDTEFHVAALAVSAGLLATVVLIAVHSRLPLVPFRHVASCTARAAVRLPASLPFFPGSSPPSTPLRI
ncbi:exported hypothetical protein [Candidatus Sulfotelmatomonas gaucii]|uniref:Uncharacterized protein n=1 Tax=Candidatus Sulfuritelmatomonas gaucii TaxID=2043161 RepID=A0A2N9LAI7_9BACT|nr:exported hypothetical protein [Candidatus Sulfotelmatomonas gaucii]